ncbi:ABC transporter permease [Luteococcus sp. OSA5]|uniref:ABC transporter permease n=1 Tax=Luteococcus sp. OSA5 TaxID=3401630 RepID=UPI003B438572
MFRDAAKEVRYHPGRIIATLVAIAISIGFMAAVSVFISTQQDALGKGMALTTSKADVVVHITQGKPGVTGKQVTEALAKVPGVQLAERSTGNYMPVGSEDRTVYTQAYAVPDERFRWAPLRDGAWPTGGNQIALSSQLAEKLGVGVGDSVDVGGKKLTVSGTTDDAPSIFFQVAYLPSATLEATSQAEVNYADWLVDVDGDPAATLDQVRSAVAPLVIDPDEPSYPGEDDKNLEVNTGEDAQAASVKEVAGEFDVMKYMLWAFSAIAALVGLIIIANTFTILLAQRRRQIGLLRAVGATGAQVRRRFLAEAILLGALGSALGLLLGTGIAWAGATYTKATYWGLSFPWTELAIEFGLGILLTVLAAMLPALRATRVAPLEALQPVATSEQQRKASVVRAIICGGFVLVGAALAWYSLDAPVGEGASVMRGPIVSALLGAILIAIGVLFGAVLFIPAVLRMMGKLFGLFGATPRLAAMNTVRNPKRAAATASALILACGLIITLQVGSATAEKTVLKEIANTYPVDVTVAHNTFSSTGKDAQPGISQQNVDKLAAVGNVSARATMSGGAVTSEGPAEVSTVVALNPQMRRVTEVVPTSLGDDRVLLPKQYKEGTKVVLKGNGQTVTLTGSPSKAVEDGMAIVSQDTMRKLVAKPSPQLAWLKMTNLDDMGTTMTQLERMMQNGEVRVGGSATEAYMVKRVLSILMMVTTGLLGVAVLIALIGVSNTLGLSVIERTRESALLRALGMQRSSLRLMLLVEALMLGLAGVLVGTLAGAFFGWLGIRSVLRQATIEAPIQFGINWPLTLGLIVIAVLSASLASIMPGRRAASATPTEALAAE